MSTRHIFHTTLPVNGTDTKVLIRFNYTKGAPDNYWEEGYPAEIELDSCEPAEAESTVNAWLDTNEGWQEFYEVATAETE